jgi:hypothetical protein
LKRQLLEKRRESEATATELADERALRHTADEQAEAMHKELRILKAGVQKMRASHESAASEVLSGEEALAEAWEEMYEEKRRRQMSEEKLACVTPSLPLAPPLSLRGLMRGCRLVVPFDSA